MRNPPLLFNPRFPRALNYHPEWILANGMGAHPLWTTEWLSEALPLRPGMRILDLGCGKALSSIFLAREFSLQVWAVDLWVTATDNHKRIRDAGLADQVFPLHCDARSLPFAADFFDAILSIDSYFYFGGDPLYLNYLANFLKPGGYLGISGAGLVQDLPVPVPEHLREWWTHDLWSLKTAAEWSHLWQRTGIVSLRSADTLQDGWKFWRDWQLSLFPDGTPEIETIRRDAGQYIGYVRVAAQKNENIQLQEYCWPDPLRSILSGYEQQPILRSEAPPLPNQSTPNPL